MGDFNYIANFNEHVGHTVTFSEISPLRSCIANCEVHDMKSTGHFYTWNNKQEGGRRVFNKIDRALCNAHWAAAYPNAEVVFLPEGDYDHSPILVQFYTQVSSAKPFKFFNFWANNDHFLEVVQGVYG